MKTIEEINKKIEEGKAVVLTANELKKMSVEKSKKEIAEKVDVVTTATFSPMCSSGVFMNIGHTTPHMKMQDVKIDGVRAYGGIATVDVYLGATEESETNPRFGGAHVIQKLINGEKVRITARGTPTDCYPRSEFDGEITLNDINQAYFYNPRNCYQNYNAAYNSSDKPLNTYMGRLDANGNTVNFSGSGEISPLLNDPLLRTIGIGTRIFFCGGTGYVSWEGTQFNKNTARDADTNLPVGPSATIAITAEMRGLNPRYVKAVYIPGYGVSIYIALGMALPVIDEDFVHDLSVRNKDIKTNVVDYATGDTVCQANYHQLINSGLIIRGKTVKCRTMSKIKESYEITELLKNEILKGNFNLTSPVAHLPFNGNVKGLKG